MKLFLDTAHPHEWTHIDGCAPIAGVTTNPTLIVQAGLRVNLQHYAALIGQACERNIPELMLQLPSPNAKEALSWAQTLSAQAGAESTGATPASRPTLALTFKLPCHPEWQAAHSALKAQGFATLLTGVSNSVQLLWAQSQRADYVAPYLSRLATAGKDVDGFLKALVAVQNAQGPKVMAASVKTEMLFASLLGYGVYACTVKPEFLVGLTHDYVTEQAMAQFAKDCALGEVEAR